jgi:hypothetical protein
MSESVVFAHEKPKVYQRALAFFRLSDEMADSWDAKHAISDHLPPADSEPVLFTWGALLMTTGANTPSLT